MINSISKRTSNPLFTHIPKISFMLSLFAHSCAFSRSRAATTISTPKFSIKSNLWKKRAANSWATKSSNLSRFTSFSGRKKARFKSKIRSSPRKGSRISEISSCSRKSRNSRISWKNSKMRIKSCRTRTLNFRMKFKAWIKQFKRKTLKSNNWSLEETILSRNWRKNNSIWTWSKTKKKTRKSST